MLLVLKRNDKVKVGEFINWIKDCADKYEKMNSEKFGNETYYMYELIDNFCDWYLNEQLDAS